MTRMTLALAMVIVAAFAPMGLTQDQAPEADATEAAQWPAIGATAADFTLPDLFNEGQEVSQAGGSPSGPPSCSLPAPFDLMST